VTVAAGIAALWLGILTSISPCPLATNVAAISFIGRQLGSPGRSLAAGAAYTAGRMVAYLLLAGVLVMGLLSQPQLSVLLQKYLNKATGPLLIIMGMVLLGLITLPSFGLPTGERAQKRLADAGVAGAGGLGFLFALSFCPVSAALFFGSMLPLALEHQSRIAIPGLYGLGTSLPVAAFAIAVALSARAAGVFFDKLTKVERVARQVTGAVFIVAGIYLTLVHVFGM
jgi:cytochrome c biogenesis protein CcdA